MNRRWGMAVVVIAAILGWWWCRDSTTTESVVTKATAPTGKARALVPKVGLSGRVVRKVGGAVASATVAISNVSPKSRSLPVVVVADAAGAWSVPELDHGEYVVGAQARGLVPVFQKIELRQPTSIELVMDEGGVTLRGTVTDIGSGPIANARVTAQHTQQRAVAAVTDASGTYELALDPSHAWLRAMHDDYASSSASIDLVAGKSFVHDFVLEPGGTVRGHVVTRDGKPMPGAEVNAMRSRVLQRAWREEEVADDDGAFVFRGVPAGVVELTARARNHASSTLEAVVVGIGEEVRDVRVTVSPAFVISGRATSKVSGTGLAGVEIELFGNPSSASATADANGVFELVGVLPGAYALNSGKGAVPLWPFDGPLVTVVDRDITGVVLELDPGVSVKGRVEPTSKARVRIEGSCRVASRWVDTDASGTFVFEQVGPGPCTVAATSDDGSEAHASITVTSHDLSNVVLALQRRASLSGQVVDGNGAPVGGAWVATQRFDRDYRGRDATTASDGTFRITGAEPGKLIVSAGLETIPEPLGKTEITLEAAQHRTGVTITIERPTLQIRGTVVDGQKPVGDARVTAFLEVPSRDEGGRIGLHGRIPSVLTTADGAFTIPNLRKGAYTIVAEGPRESARAEQMHLESGASVRLVLAPLGTLEGTVMLGSAPVKDYSVSCELDLTACACSRADTHVKRRFETATYRLERIPPGRYNCTVRSDVGWKPTVVDISGSTRLDVVLDPVGSIVGTLVDIVTGAPLANTYVFPTDRPYYERVLGGSKPSDASGRFRVDGVRAGKTDLVVMPRERFHDDVYLSSQRTIEPGQTTDLGVIEAPAQQHPPGTLGYKTQTHARGWRVTSVDVSGPAEAAGLRVGDIITTINGRTIEKLREFSWTNLYVVGQTYQHALESGATISVTATERR